MPSKKTKYQVEALMDGSWKILDREVSREEAIKIKQWRESLGEIARINPMSESSMPKDHPTYLLRLAMEEGEAVAAELIHTNPDGIARGEKLTTKQYHFLLKQITDRLRKSGKLPMKPISEIRFQAFEGPFWEVLHNSSLI
jgi:hypothetical protein